MEKVTPKVISTVWRHWKPIFIKSKMMLIGTFIFYSVAMYVELMFRPTQWKQVFDSLTAHQSPWKPFTYIVIASIVAWILHRIAEITIARGETKVLRDLKIYTMKGLLGKSMHFFITNQSGGLTTKAERFVDVSEDVIDALVYSILRSLILVVYLVVYSWILIPDLTAALVLWVILFMVVTIFLSKIRMRLDLQLYEAESATTDQRTGTLLSIFTLRVFSAVSKAQAAFERSVEYEYEKRKKAWSFSNVQSATQGFLMILLELYCMNIIIAKTISGVYTVGTAAMVQAYIAALSLYMWEFGRNVIKVKTSFASAYEMAQMLDEHSPEPIADISLAKKINGNSIEVSEVTFGYNEGVNALKDFSFTFVAGRRYGIVGKTGSGKSTLTKLILKAYDVTNGSIHVCNENIEHVNKLSLRSWISYVPQEPQFPSWTVREIIAMGKQSAGDEEILTAARKASCDFIWGKLPEGFSTRVGERGVLLSGGERQRLAIAAAILKDGPIVIMDEPTSALDAFTERSIQDAIQMHFAGKTLIVIAHRLSTVAVLDEIILLDNGKVKDCGAHTNLLQSSQEYFEMWELQTKPQLV